MTASPSYRRPYFLLSTFCFLLSFSLSACSSSHTKGDDLNVIIPKLIDEMKGPSAVEQASNLFNATNPDARRIAVAYLSKKKWGHEPPYMKAYHVLATSDPNSMVRGQALRALGTSHDPAVAPDLIAGLENTDPIVRRDASGAMLDIVSPTFVDPLIEHLRTDPDTQVRINAATALKKYPQPAVAKALADALDDKDVAVNYRAWQSLSAITGQTLTPDRAPWVEYLQTRYPSTPPSTTRPG